MPLLRQWIYRAATRLAQDPRVREKAAELLETEVKPRAAAAWREAKPKLRSARDELREIAAEADPREDPRAFVAKIRERFRDRDTDD
jgi:hypothetical protein